MQYRPEIDGLRAIAILTVVAFHAGFSAFAGGFLGVDVFFVISGYLITSIIIKELAAGNFSILKFYERRARRILPALFLVMLSTIPFVIVWFSYSDTQKFFTSLISTSTFWSNIQFFEEHGYFDTRAELKPLLHTWSLAVEEQYYLIAPVFLMVFWRFGRNKILWLTIAIGLASLIGAELLSIRKPEASFYLLPTRCWEILTGGLVALLVSRPDWQGFSQKSNNLLSLLAGLLLIASLIWFDAFVRHPGFFTLAPVLASALIILCAQKGTLVNKILSHKFFVGIGLISYSTYLWHNVLFVFAKYNGFEKDALLLMLVLGGLSFLLGYLSWRFIERPFRNREFLSQSSVFKLSIAGILFFVLIGFGGRAFVRSDLVDEIANKNLITGAQTGSERVLVLGDSHAKHLLYGLKGELQGEIAALTYDSCLPYKGIEISTVFGTCVPFFDLLKTKLNENKQLEFLLISHMGQSYLDNTSFDDESKPRVADMTFSLKGTLKGSPEITDRWVLFEKAARETFEFLTGLENKKIMFLLDIPELSFEQSACGLSALHLKVFDQKYKLREKNIKNCEILRSKFDARVKRYHSLIKRILKDFPSIILFDPTEKFCDDRTCWATLNDHFLYIDKDHLSNYGSSYLAKSLAPVILDNLQQGAR